MNRLPEKIKKAIPEDLVPAVEALCKSLDDAHFRCGTVTEVYCYNLLHPDEKLADVHEHKLAMNQLKAIVGPIVTRTCDQHIRAGTAPAFFHAMFELYNAGVTAQAMRVFMDLLEIGRAHEAGLGIPHVQWAHDLTLELAKTYESRAKRWIRSVCDPPANDIDFRSGDLDDMSLGRTWCAPLLITMRPSRHMPFDQGQVWDRMDRETTKIWMNSFVEFFTIHIKLHIDRLADEKTIELAKKPKPASTSEASVREPDLGSHQAESANPSPNVKREFRKLKTEERNKKIVAEFRKLKQRKPGESDVWYSKQLSKLAIAAELNEETIRKIIRN